MLDLYNAYGTVRMGQLFAFTVLCIKHCAASYCIISFFTWQVEQLHKIFKLCGSPSEEYWRTTKLPHSTVFKPSQPYKRRIAETLRDLPYAAVGLMETLLSVDPADRGSAASALNNEVCLPPTLNPFP